MRRLKRDASIASLLIPLEHNVYEGRITSGEAADRVLDAFLHKSTTMNAVGDTR
jgi:hypothetical protein